MIQVVLILGVVASATAIILTKMILNHKQKMRGSNEKNITNN